MSAGEQCTSTPQRGAALNPAGESPNTSPVPAGCCYYPGNFFRRRQNQKQVRFKSSSRGKSGTGLLRQKNTSVSRSTRSPSRKSFYSAVSKMTQANLMRSPSTAEVSDGRDAAGGATCPCGFPAHSAFVPATPLVIPPNIEPGSRAELEIHAQAILGRWITVVERSDSLEPQMIYVGIGKMKRMVMNRLGAIPLGAELVDDGTTLKVWIETPTGNKATHASLVGKETFDQDGDLGDWTATTSIQDYSSKVFCEGREVRALQMERHNPKLGVAYETKVVLPDAEFGKILLYNITIHPPNNGAPISVNRIYKPAN